MEDEDFYTPMEAERLLRRTDKPISERRIRQMLQAGELEGYKDRNGCWYVAQHEVHRLMQERGQLQRSSDMPVEGQHGTGERLDSVYRLEVSSSNIVRYIEREERLRDEEGLDARDPEYRWRWERSKCGKESERPEEQQDNRSS
jgi:hypothetical protein